MIRSSTAAAFALAAALCAGPALAQTTGSNAPKNPPPNATMGAGATDSHGVNMNAGHASSAATSTTPAMGANTATGNTPSNGNSTPAAGANTANSNSSAVGATSNSATDNAANHNTAAPALGANTANRNDTPAAHNPVLTDNNNVRASKVIGSDVYNDKNEKIGSIDDILMGQDHQAKAAILSVGGFLGIGSKLVEVPYDKLQFGDTVKNDDHKVMMPGATKDTLKGMPDYHYRG